MVYNARNIYWEKFRGQKCFQRLLCLLSILRGGARTHTPLSKMYLNTIEETRENKIAVW